MIKKKKKMEEKEKEKEKLDEDIKEIKEDISLGISD